MTPTIPGAVFRLRGLPASCGQKEGPAFACLRLAQTRRLRLILSDDVLAEITDVLNRPELQGKFKSLTPEIAAAFLRDLSGNADFLSEVPQAFTYARDPADEHQINLAIASGARYLVTWDNDLLDLMDETSAAGSDFSPTIPRPLHRQPRHLDSRNDRAGNALNVDILRGDRNGE